MTTSSSFTPHPPSLISEFAAFAETLADAAARASLPYFRAEIDVADKSGGADFDPVTAADQEAEAAIRALIHETYPDHGILGEEGGAEKGASPFRWVLDPIDGTRAFIAGLPLWTTLIALNDGTRPIIGLIDQPYLGERYLGTPSGAFLQSRGEMRLLSTRPRVSLREAIFSTTTPQLFESPREKRIHEALLAGTRLTRYGCDAYAYAQLAAGRIDLVVEPGLKPWDVQALIPVIEAAGGAIANFDGGPADEGGSIIAAAHQDLLEECRALISRTQ
jgi:myo-inositol-1(or 4)-monophosphatase